MPTILFICTGNTCRSPMAEAIARHCVDTGEAGDLPDLFITSAGLFAVDGGAISHATLAALASRDIEHEARSRALTPAMVRKADVVLCMTETHVRAVCTLVDDDAEQAAKVCRLDPDRDIVDPISMGVETYESMAEAFGELIPRRIRELLEP